MNVLPQIRNNFVALLSIFYAGWRDHKTDHHRNIRVAGFEILKNLGELQTVVDYAHYEKDRQLGNPITGWGRVMLIRDLAQIMPAPVPQAAERVFQTWQTQWESVSDDEAAVQRVTGEIAAARKAVLEVLRKLE